MTWNLINSLDYQLHASFKANNIDIPTDDFEVVNANGTLTQHLGGYLGIGANYRFSDKWQARAGLLIEETGRRTNINSFPRNYLLESGMSLSLNYRF